MARPTSSRFRFVSRVCRWFALLALPGALAAGEPPTKETKSADFGPSRGASGQPAQWWRQVDTGPFIADTFMTARNGAVAALKGVAVKVGPAREATLLFDTELLAWRAGFDGAAVLEGTAWDGSHGGNSHIPNGAGSLYFANFEGLGIATAGRWEDSRNPKFGPLPRTVGRYRGLYRHGWQTVIHYDVGGVPVWEMPGYEAAGGARAVTRTIETGAATAEFELLVEAGGASAGDARLKPEVRVLLAGAPAGVALVKGPAGRLTVKIAAGTPAARFKIAYAEKGFAAAALQPAAELAPLTRGGPGLWPQTFAVKGQLDPQAAEKTYAVDVIPLPNENPWKSPPRFGGFDFFADGKRIAASTWNGDVWIADGIAGDLAAVTWRRFAGGMFQTLGLKIVDGLVHTQGRDQITRLHDLNGDGEADYYECFNNDVMITPGFHEFSFDLETDRAGNFYFSKAMPVNQGGRGFSPWTPHNGTVMKVSKDGSKLDVVAWGLRAPGGVGVSPDGIVTTGENEGSFVPQCKITWTPPGKVTFNGVVPGTWERRGWQGPLPGAPTDYDRPLVWLPYNADNSSGSQTWVPESTKWDPRHAGEMLHLSYGKSSIFRVLRDDVGGTAQGAVYRLPIDVSAAVMRARFHPADGQLYVIGFRGWQTNGRDAFQRVRYTGVTTAQPAGLQAHANGVLLRFSAPLDPRTAEDPARYSVSKWNYVWGPQYGSGRFSIDQRDAEAELKAQTVASKGAQNSIDTVTVAAAKLVEDGRAVFLYVPKMTAAMQVEVKLDLADTKGGRVRDTLYATVHAMAPEYRVPGLRWEDIRVADTAPAGEPGLVLTFDSETTDTLRVDQLALTVPAGTSPSVFMATRGFGAAWRGTLVVPERDDYTFSLEGAGTVALQIDGKVIASGELPLTARLPVTLAKGAHAIFCSYRSAKEGESRVRLLWSSPQFRPEPVPAAAFRHLPGADLESWSKVRLGREIFAAAQCVKCHQPRGGPLREATPELLAAAPDLAQAGRRFEAGWLEAWIAQPGGRCPTVAPRHAADLAAHLAAQRGAELPAATIGTDAATIAQGAALAEKLHLGPWLAPMAKERRHTDAGLVAFLQAPAAHHADTAFPDLRLTRAEASQLAAYVRSKQPATRALSRPGDATAGAAAMASCVACHEPAAKRAATVASLEEIARGDWTVRGCVAENRGRAPDLRLTRAEVAALIAFRNADRDVGFASLRRFVPAEYAAQQVKALGCAQCHTAGGENKLPDISRAGEKFETEWLAKLLAGQAGRIRPWQEARMPAFASRAANLAAGLAARQGLPLKAGGSVPAKNAELAGLGEKIAGETGYSCIACHDAGSRKAVQVFEGQGPNLQVAGARLRYDYYQRWMHWPQRLAPTTIMPRYTKDRDRALLDTHFGGDAARQFEAVWHWIGTLEAPAR